MFFMSVWIVHVLSAADHVIKLPLSLLASGSVGTNGLQVLHLHPGVTDSSLYLCLSTHLPSYHTLGANRTHFITLIHSHPASVAQ